MRQIKSLLKFGAGILLALLLFYLCTQISQAQTIYPYFGPGGCLTGTGTIQGINTNAAGCTITGGITNTQVFIASGTWTAPASGTVVRIICIGAGGGGGGGVAAGSSGGGAGGGGGYFGEMTLPLSSLPASVTVTVASGGAGGLATFAGGGGGPTSFGTLITCFGGGGGAAGGATSWGGSGGNPKAAGVTAPTSAGTACAAATIGCNPGISSGTNGAGSNAQKQWLYLSNSGVGGLGCPNSCNTSAGNLGIYDGALNACGGGLGGNGSFAGYAACGNFYNGYNEAAGGAACGTTSCVAGNGTAGAAAPFGSWAPGGGGGGGGGCSGTTCSAGSGGNGAIGSGGGGGGSASTAGSTSGPGGNGGGGEVVVITFR